MPVNNRARFYYLLHLADNALILAQRNSEWTGHGPVLEQDIAITNISLDLLGQARNLYDAAASLYNLMNDEEQTSVKELMPFAWTRFNREMQEDDLAFLRDERQYLNLLINELPRGDWAFSILRQFFFSAFQSIQLDSLQQHADESINAIAVKSLKEVRYHLRWSSEWVIRLGDGTEESRRRIQKALTELWPFTDEFFVPGWFETEGEQKIITDPSGWRNLWLSMVRAVFSEAGLEIPSEQGFQSGGKSGIHSESLGYLLSEMQYLQRTYPNVTW